MDILKHETQCKRGICFYLWAALVWGFSLAAQKEGLKYIDPFIFTSVRCILGGIVMLPFVLVLQKKTIF